LYLVSRSTTRGDIRQNTLGSVKNDLVTITVEPSLGTGPSRAVTKAEAINHTNTLEEASEVARCSQLGPEKERLRILLVDVSRTREEALIELRNAKGTFEYTIWREVVRSLGTTIEYLEDALEVSASSILTTQQGTTLILFHPNDYISFYIDETVQPNWIHE
jgi:hypothetical protein